MNQQLHSSHHKLPKKPFTSNNSQKNSDSQSKYAVFFFFFNFLSIYLLTFVIPLAALSRDSIKHSDASFSLVIIISINFLCAASFQAEVLI